MVTLMPWMGISCTSFIRSESCGGLQRQIDGVDRLATEGRVHHDGRERAADRVARHAVDLGGRVHLVDAVGLEQGAGGDLAGAGLLAQGGGGEGKGRSGAHAQHARDDPRVAHADADDVGVVVHALQEADEGEVVDQRLGGGDDLDEVGVEGLDAAEDIVQFARSGEVVMADEKADAGIAQLLQIALFEALGGFEFKVHKMEPGLRAFAEDLQFGRERAGELAPICRAATGGDAGGGCVFGEELLEPGQCQQRLLQVIQAKLKKRKLFDHRGCLFNHLRGRGAGNGDAHLGNAGSEEVGCYSGHIQSHGRNRVSYRAIGQDATFLLNRCDC